MIRNVLAVVDVANPAYAGVVLQRATAKGMAPQKDLWTKWWEEDGGRTEIANLLAEEDA